MFEKSMKVKITFTAPVLGGSPNSETIYSDFIASKAPDALTMEEEIAQFGAVAVEGEKTTVFMRTLIDGEEVPTMWSYHIKGFFKAAGTALRRPKKMKNKTESSKLAAHKRVIVEEINIMPRQIVLHAPDGIPTEEAITIHQRPLRINTAVERVALASSEMLPPGTWAEFEINLMSEEYEAAVREWLDYGKYYGLGQRRNDGFGTFEWEEIQ